MSYAHAVVLGIVQGLTEFLPVSSSGHLILVPRLFGWPDQGLAVDAALPSAPGSLVLTFALTVRASAGTVSLRSGLVVSAPPRRTPG